MQTLNTVFLATAILIGSGCSHTTAETTARIDGDTTAHSRAFLAEFQAAYSYDTAYMERLLDLSPSSYALFESSMALSAHREPLPANVHFVALLSALRADSCSECTQLTLRMAVEAGVERSLLQTLHDEPSALPPLLRQVHDHAAQIVRGENADPARVQALQKALGDEAFGIMTLNIIGVRLYPALRRALGAEYAYPLPHLDF